MSLVLLRFRLSIKAQKKGSAMKKSRVQFRLAILFFASVLISGFAFASSTADHSKFKELDKDFKTGPEVTEACLICHT